MGSSPTKFPVFRSQPREIVRCGLHKLDNCRVFHGKKLDSKMVMEDIDKLHTKQIKIVCISDTHSMHDTLDLPTCDILIHAGDFTNTGGVSEIQNFEKFATELLATGKAKHVILVAGNHDITLDPLFYAVTGKNAFHKDNPQSCEVARESLKNTIYLEDDFVIVEGIKIYGAPWQPDFHDWAFCLQRSSDRLRQKWASIPDDTDILISHTPPAFHGDGVKVTLPGPGRQQGIVKYGCEDLLDRVEKIRPKLHVFGHIHQGYGVTRQRGMKTTFVNAAICTSKYEPQHKPIVCYINRPEQLKESSDQSIDVLDIPADPASAASQGSSEEDEYHHHSRFSSIEEDLKSTYSRSRTSQVSYHSKRYSDVSAQYKYSNPGPIWHDDAEYNNCERCGVEFGLITRKHHCRRCGSVICGDCSGFVHLFYMQQQGETVRVCLKDCPALKLPQNNASAISA